MTYYVTVSPMGSRTQTGTDKAGQFFVKEGFFRTGSIRISQVHTSRDCPYAKLRADNAEVAQVVAIDEIYLAMPLFRDLRMCTKCGSWPAEQCPPDAPSDTTEGQAPGHRTREIAWVRVAPSGKNLTLGVAHSDRDCQFLRSQCIHHREADVIPVHSPILLKRLRRCGLCYSAAEYEAKLHVWQKERAMGGAA